MFEKVKNEKRFWGFNVSAALARIALLMGVSCLGCDLDGREIIRQLAEQVEDSGEDTATDSPGEDTGAGESEDTASPGDAGGTDNGDTGGGADTDPILDTGEIGGTDDNCVCECVCDTGAGDTPPAGDSDADVDSALDSDVDTAPDTGGAVDTGGSADDPSDTGLDPLACLIISEYVEGSSRNKGVELFNCGDSAIDLTAYAICLYSNDNTECGTTLALTGVLEAGAVTTVCHTSADAIPVCHHASGVANFSGDDRLALLQNDTVIDAFGELPVRPEGSPWADITLRRCNFTPYSGIGTFDPTADYTTHDADDFSDFGVPPGAATCGP